MRDQLLNGEQFHSVTEARVVLADWVELYNTVRPHRALGMKAPARYAIEWHKANPDGRRDGRSASAINGSAKGGG
jgi:transposase InsO family protein